MAIICPMCQDHGRGRVEMTFQHEKESAQVFECPTCGTMRAVTKDLAGGSQGSGAKDDGRRSALGSGFGPGTATFRANYRKN